MQESKTIEPYEIKPTFGMKIKDHATAQALANYLTIKPIVIASKECEEGGYWVQYESDSIDQMERMQIAIDSFIAGRESKGE